MVNVLISADSKFPISRKTIKDAVEKVIKERGIKSDVEVSILVCGTRKSRDLAEKYLSDNFPHDVLSFPLIDEATESVSPTAKSAKGFVEFQNSLLVLGDIVICYPLCQEEANEENIRLDDKINELVAHGLLHLLGEHHE